MDYTVTSTAPAAFTVGGATGYSGLTRTYLYENRHRLDWIKAGRRSLITRESLDRLLLELLHETSTAAGTSRRPRTAFGSKPAVKAGKREPLSSPGQRDQTRELTDEKL
jgi:hypothetical protein